MGLITFGAFFIIWSMMSLPLIAFKPTSICFTLTVGSLLCMAGLAFFLGFKTFRIKVFTGKRAIYTAGYILSLLAGLVTSYFYESYLLALVSIVAQFIFFSYILLVNLPYGKNVLDCVYGSIFGGVKGVAKAAANGAKEKIGSLRA